MSPRPRGREVKTGSRGAAPVKSESLPAGIVGFEGAGLLDTGVGTEAVPDPTGGIAALAEVVNAAALAGILSFWPTRILSLFRVLAERRALTLTPNWPAILIEESPRLHHIHLRTPSGIPRQGGGSRGTRRPGGEGGRRRGRDGKMNRLPNLKFFGIHAGVGGGKRRQAHMRVFGDGGQGIALDDLVITPVAKGRDFSASHRRG